MYVCIDKKNKRVIAHFNPQHGYGGMKWGEFIGTTIGNQVLKLLIEEFCNENCTWIIVSDYGFASDASCNGEALYNEAEDTQKIGFDSKFVERALELGFTTKENIDFWQRIHACVTNCHVYN